MPQQTTQSRSRSTDESHEQTQTPSAFEFLSELLPARNFTGELIEDQVGETKYYGRAVRTDRSETLFDRIARRLHRQQSPHLVLTGAKGIGRTSAVRELSRLSAQGKYPFLEDATFLWFDCSAVRPEDSRNCLESILTVAREQPGVVLCLSGFAALFPRPNGGTNGPLILAAARRPEVRIIGLMEPHEYQDLIASDVKLRDVFGHIELTEPEPGTTLKIALDAADEIQQATGQTLTSAAIDRAVVLSSSFLFQQAQPGKTLRILKQACEDARFEQTQLGQEPQPIGPERIDCVLEELTGIPASTFSGIADEIDCEAALTQTDRPRLPTEARSRFRSWLSAPASLMKFRLESLLKDSFNFQMAVTGSSAPSPHARHQIQPNAHRRWQIEWRLPATRLRGGNESAACLRW